MKYERLTKYNEYNHNAEVYAYTVGKEDIYFDGVDIVGNENSSLAQETIDKLAILEDKIEQGTLVELPCNVGDTVYYHKVKLNEFCPAKVIGIHINYYTPSMPIWITIEYESTLIGRQEEKMASEVFGRLCKKTKAEAKEKLKELQNETKG